MGIFNYDKIKKLLTNNYEIAVETGICKGDGIKIFLHILIKYIQSK